MRVVVARERCRGAGLCALTAPEVFDQRDDDGTVVLLVEEPAPELEDAVLRAAELCPNAVIQVVGQPAPR